ncbi:MAG: excinuclease ABC subunit UvrC [Thermodesulfobacteriota bacterium]|nr:excinuclease ABC subunit UvrC [Thermodesulfobacteriota bacterium]
MALSEDILSTISHGTGVYLFKDAKDLVLYVGKAKDLRKRLASYFQKRREQGTRTEALFTRAASIETILTENEKEALILECNLIKKHRPRYNVVLRDDKNYLSLRLDPCQKFPRITIVRRPADDGAIYFGPFSSAASVRETLRSLQHIFPLRRCGDIVFKSRTRPCLNYQIKRCAAPCVGLISEEEYRKLVAQVVLFFRGQLQDLVKIFEKEMQTLAGRLEYEKAALYRDRLSAIKRTLEKQSVTSTRLVDRDVIGLYRQDGSVQISILFVRNGAVIGHKTFPFREAPATNEEILSHFLRQFYGEGKYIPGEILIPLAMEDHAVIASWLGEKTGKKVSILIPQKGDRHRLLLLSMKNAEGSFRQKLKEEGDRHNLLTLLQEKLGLRYYPERIEGLDISNIGGEMAVGSLVAFINGIPGRSLYRRYKIKLPERPDDYAMMREVVSRRLRRAKEEDPWPNMLLIDGGKGHLNVARQALKDLGCSGRVDLIALAKGKKGETDKVYLPERKNPVLWKRNSPLLLYLQRIRDEAHRFAIEYHHKLRKRGLTRSLLDEIPGVGSVLKKRLLIHFGSVEKLKGASVEEIASVKGINPSLAANIKAFLENYKRAHSITE